MWHKSRKYLGATLHGRRVKEGKQHRELHRLHVPHTHWFISKQTGRRYGVRVV